MLCGAECPSALLQHNVLDEQTWKAQEGLVAAVNS
jgi:hypothetical protein